MVSLPTDRRDIFFFSSLHLFIPPSYVSSHWPLLTHHRTRDTPPIVHRLHQQPRTTPPQQGSHCPRSKTIETLPPWRVFGRFARPRHLPQCAHPPSHRPSSPPRLLVESAVSLLLLGALANGANSTAHCAMPTLWCCTARPPVKRERKEERERTVEKEPTMEQRELLRPPAM